jgi:hypothetical protein
MTQHPTDEKQYIDHKDHEIHEGHEGSMTQFRICCVSFVFFVVKNRRASIKTFQQEKTEAAESHPNSVNSVVSCSQNHPHF